MRQHYLRRVVAIAGLTVWVLPIPAQRTFAQCAFTSGSTGADGAFAPTADVKLILPPDGVFNFTSVDIPSGVTVTFKKNAQNTPVVILATGDVSVKGTIDVSGTDATGSLPGRGGPGGFDGGIGGFGCAGAGLGPGGGAPGCAGSSKANGGRGGFGTAGASSVSPPNGGPVYGSDSLVPFIGGSGGGGGDDTLFLGGGGGGGGGAILIAASGTIDVPQAILARGGAGGFPTPVFVFGGGGSGGAIRLIANTISGSGSVDVSSGSDNFGAGVSGLGRIRLEACELLFGGPLPPTVRLGQPSPAFARGLPALSITSVGGFSAPAQPAGSFAAPPDVSLPPGTNTVTVQLAGSGIPLGTTVTVKVTPNSGAPSMVTSAPLSGTVASSTGAADVTLASGTSIISAEVTVPVASGAAALAMGSINGEQIKSIRVSTRFGGRSSLAYVTASGKEVEIASSL